VGVRETLNKQPGITTGATIGIIFLAFIFIIYEVSGGRHPRITNRAFYSADDGASFFTDDLKLVPPFDSGGKKAVKAYVYRCSDGKQFVGYLERYSDVAKRRIENADASGNVEVLAQARAMGLEVKAPLTGDKGWMKETPMTADKLSLIQCQGSGELAQPVIP